MDDKLAYTAPDDAPVQEPINLDRTNYTPLPDPVLGDRAARADFALGDKSPGPQVLKDAFRSGQEPQIRQQAAAQANVDFQQQKLNTIKTAASQGTPVTDTEVHGIMALGTTPEANPDTVFEDKFAKNIVSYGVAGDPGKNLVFQSAFDTQPDKTREGMQIAAAQVSRKHQAQDVLEQTQSARDQLPWFNTDPNARDQQDKAGDLAKTILSGGIAQYVNQRNLLNESPTNSFLPGSNKLEQIQYLYLLPHDQFKPALMAAAGPGSPLFKESPSSALDFVRAATGFSTSDAYVDNTYGIANVAGILPVGSALKGIGMLRGGKAVASVSEGVQSMEQALKNANSVLKESSKAPQVPPPGGLAAAQDVLSQSSIPPTPGYYVPKAAVTKQVFPTPNTSQTVARDITTRVENGVPRVFGEDGVEVQLSRTPEVGHLPVSVESSGKNTITQRNGETTDYTPGGQQGRIYVTTKERDNLSSVLQQDKNYQLLTDDQGRVYVGNRDNGGKRVSGTSIVTPKTEPERNLHPIDVGEGNDKSVFGDRITRVDNNVQQNIKFGPEIVPNADVETRVALADIVKSQAETNPQDVLSKMGQHEQAVTVAAQEKINDNFAQVIRSGDVEAIRRNVPSLASPQLYFNNASSLTRERADRLAQNATQASLDLSQAITDPVRVERMTQDAKDRAIEIAKTQVKEKYNRASDAILDQVEHWDSASNTYHIETKFGKKDGTLFDSSIQANHYRTFQYRIGDAGVVKETPRTTSKIVPRAEGETSSNGKLTYVAQGEGNHHFAYESSQGKLDVSAHLEGTALHIDNVSKAGKGVYDTELVNKLGPKETKDILSSLREFFPNAQSAFGYRAKVGTDFERPAAVNFPTSSVQQEGNQFYISHIQHADETQSGVRNSLIVSGNETPRGWWNSLATAITGKFAPLGNSIRSSASTLAPFQMNNRVVATHSPSIMRNAIEDVSKNIQKMGNWTTGERQEMQTILEHNRDYMSPDGVRGQFYKSAFEFETAFNGRFGKMPSEKQIVAYDQFTRLSDLDWTLRELDALRDKARLGIRNYRITWKGEDPNGIPQTTKSDYFNGKLVKDFDPLNTQNANVYVVPDKKFTTKFDLKDASPWSKQVDDKIKSGEYQIIQMYNPREKPLLATTGVKDDVHFAVVDKYEDKAVSFGENVPYRPGGHVIYQDQFYLKQPKIGPGTNGRLTHFGDTTIKSLATEREANQWADKYNTAREFLRTGDEAGLQAYMAQGHLPETVPDLKRMFSDGTLSVDHPIVTTHAARDTFQSNEALARQYPGLKDQFSSYNLSQTQGTDFLQDRGAQLNTIARSGTTENPIYTNVPSRLYDPYTALQKGMSQIVRSRWMADYKISAAESWVQEFGLLFDQSKLPIDKLRQNPSYWLYHADGNIDAGVMKTNPELVTAAMTSRKNILNFIGARDEVGSILEGLKNKLLSGIEGVAGPNAARIAGEKVLPAISNAPEYARQAAFNAVIGMFNPAQLIQQAQGLAHVYALAPMNAIQSTTASSLMRMFRYTENPAILDHAANIASYFGWDKDHFLEAIDAWKRSGVHNIGGETALLSTTSDPQIFKSAGRAFLDKGQMFFKAGESIVRDTSWFTAYREWKAANPTAILDNRAMGEIGNRYQILSLDMTRASNSALNEGVLSMPTQFWTWNARFTEQMLGTRLTMGEKARVATMYSALYGIPATLGGITFGAVPMANYGDIRQYALANNINVHDKYYEALSEGVPTALLNSVTGHETSLQRFSPNATQLKEIIDGKKSVPEILGGASGGFVAQLAKTVWPALMYGFSAIKKDSGFPIKMNDLTNLAENMSSFNNAEKAVIGWNLGQYISKTEGMVDNHIDHYESALLALGLNPQRVNDAYTKMDYNKAREEVAKSMGKKMVEDWTLAMKGFMRGDMQTGVDYMTRVQGWSAYGNLTKAQEVDIYKQAMHGNESLVDSVEKKFRELNPNLQAIPAFKQYLENKH